MYSNFLDPTKVYIGKDQQKLDKNHDFLMADMFRQCYCHHRNPFLRAKSKVANMLRCALSVCKYARLYPKQDIH